MTESGLFLSRRIRISKIYLSELTNNISSVISEDEIYLIALGINIDSREILKKICGELKLILEN